MLKVFLRFSVLLLVLTAFLHIAYGDQPTKSAYSTREPQSKTLWKLAHCGLPAWFFSGGAFHPMAGRRRSVGTAYGQPIYIVNEPSKEVAARIERTAQALIEAARDHYAPMASLCRGNLLSRLNVYCRWSIWSPYDLKGRAILAGVRMLSTQLRSIRAQYQKHPLTTTDIINIRSKMQKSFRFRKYYAQMSRDVLRLEYPTVAAINWRIRTLKKWPPATAMLWEYGLFRMQCIVAGRRILQIFPARSTWKPDKLRIGSLFPPGRPITSKRVDKANGALFEADKILYAQILVDTKKGRIILTQYGDVSKIMTCVRGILFAGSR